MKEATFIIIIIIILAPDTSKIERPAYELPPGWWAPELSGSQVQVQVQRSPVELDGSRYY